MSEAPLKKSTLLAYVLPGAPIAGLGLPIVVYLPPFYAQELGLGLALVGTIFMLARFWDVVTDPLMGVLSDRFPSRWGRRRHWIVLAVPILVGCVYMVFMPGETFFGAPISAGYLLFWMFLLYIGYTLITISHLAWGAELHADYNERSRVQGWREIAVIAGMVAVLAIPAIVDQVSDGKDAAARVAAMGWFIILLMPPAVYVAVTRVPEHPHQRSTTHTSTSFMKTWLMVWRNIPLRRLVVTDLVAGLAGGTTGSLFIFFAHHVLGVGTVASVLLLVYFLSGCFAAQIWIRLSYRWGKHRTLAAAAIFKMCVVPLLLLIPFGSITFSAIGFIIFGLSYASVPFLLRAIVADVADHDEAQSGVQRTGLYYSLLTLTGKVGYALAVGITYPLLAWIGFDASLVNPPDVMQGFIAVYIGVPILAELLIVAFMWNFPIDADRQAETRRILEQRRAEIAVGATAE